MKLEVKKVEKLVSATKMSTFRKEYRVLLKSLCQKLMEKSPLKSLIVICAAALSPCNMVKDSEVSVLKFERLADYLHEQKHITSQQCDESKSEYEKFLGNIVKVNREKFTKFDTSIEQVDQFLGGFLNGAKEFKSLCFIFKFICTLSHGQSQIERGFNVNKDVLCVNMERKSLNARGMVYDHVTSTKMSVESFEVKKDLIQSCIGAHSKYLMNLEENKNKEEKSRKRHEMNRFDLNY